MKSEVIYCLAEIDGPPFYVGRSVHWQKRWKEHIYCARKEVNVEAKYQHIRKLWKQGKDFEMIILDENPGLRYEKYYHYLLGTEYDLKNEKMGDAFQREDFVLGKMHTEKRKFSGPEEFLKVLDLEIEAQKANERAARTQAKISGQNSIDTFRELRWVRSEFAPESLSAVDFENESKFMSPGTKALLEKRNRKG